MLSVAGTLPATAAGQSTDTAESLRACAQIADDAARVDCYEALGKEALAAENAAEPGAPEIPSGSTNAGVAGLAGSADPGTAPTSVPLKGDHPQQEYRIVVSSCRISNAGETHFNLVNGEIWKRTGGRAVRESECSFSATLRKDFFGYKMVVDEDKGSVRVKRVK
jgi:hypothetical protein